MCRDTDSETIHHAQLGSGKDLIQLPRVDKDVTRSGDVRV